LGFESHLLIAVVSGVVLNKECHTEGTPTVGLLAF